MVLQRDGDRGQTLLSGGLRFSADDVGYLRSQAGAAALATVAELELTDATRVADVAAARAHFGDRAAVLVETVLLRRRAVEKLSGPGFAVSDWLFTDEALQQATAAPVALHRAGRLAEGGPDVVVHDATCSIGTELAALRGRGITAVGSDLDSVRLAMARHNLGPVGLCRADALHPVTRDAVLVVDPSRRAQGRRRLRIDDYQPGLAALLDAYRDRDFAVKCAPGIDFDEVRRLGFDGEIEVTSYRGSVREACLWSAGLARPGVTRRASVLDRDEQLTDADPDDCPVRPVGRWIVDPDGAVVRAGLVRHYGARHGLWQLDPDIAYLSGDRLPAAVRGFEVIEQLVFDERRLRQALSALDCGSLEVLVRGVRVDPDALRKRMRLRGDRPLSVVITRIGARASGRAMAFVCRASR
ncbi:MULTISPECIES: THUMP-like domain-containing protein [Mycobacterium]|uniref:THUMP-like domain-containing protein n=1 Tax=Mycobacterium TaxID=1763 RepID=UPI001CDA0A5A|nr:MULTISPECIES: class I SAM-dependent methyltransferase [Mycobacterium]MCA2240788.1 class I SAM-dependent methyltransferase [Mycobacterium sp. WUMAC-067]MCA2313240.1 class I SAM-dependent methyltransferase [Mycobacterium sp. WUMAC-025]MEE3750452.1 class I SAM-dependent methyltransferase [Mycobacterium intracellulare]